MRIQAFILLLLTLGSLASRGQDTIQPRYQSVFGDSCATWSVYYYIDRTIYGTLTRQAFTEESIIINQTPYKLLRCVLDFTWEWVDFYPEESLFLRESPDHSKLYYKEHLIADPARSFSEILIMDLDLNVGDTLDTHGWSDLILRNEPEVPVIRIDTIYYSDGRKVLQTNYQKGNRYFPNGYDTLLFIEGVGPSWGPFYAGNVEPLSLICYNKDGEPIYQGQMYRPEREMPCYITSYGPYALKIADNAEAYEAAAYPNPTRNIVNIALSRPSFYTVTVVSPTGNVVHHHAFNGESTCVDLQEHPCGVYFLTITTIDNPHKQSLKIIKL